ncbi:MAG: hypothetical protein M1540_04065 [Candidatus Bathyarchaeota archaeon]|nr:hypothetical protein [Candidatus Bathyarchaeota archaeon]
MYEVPRLAIEIASAILYFILVRYMIKPYGLTREERYLGLPLGFGFLGVAETILAIGIILPIHGIGTVSVVMRTFAFVFLAFTYYFSKKPSKNSRFAWIIILSSIIVGLTTWILSLVSAPLMTIGITTSFGIFLRILALVCLSYICIHTLRSHIKSLDPTTIWIPLGFILLAISQYSQLIRAADENYLYGVAFVGGLAARLIGLAVFLYVAYRTFYRATKRGGINEADRP